MNFPQRMQGNLMTEWETKAGDVNFMMLLPGEARKNSIAFGNDPRPFAEDAIRWTELGAVIIHV